MIKLFKNKYIIIFFERALWLKYLIKKLYFKMQSSKCEHGKQKRYCKECGGSAFCEHEKRKDRCKECGGSAFCEHGKQKYYCKECGGSAFCEHGKRKKCCKECGGSAFCEHGKRKEFCKECGGSQICEHGKQKRYCKECGGSQICKHIKNKALCKECEGSGLCKNLWCETTKNKKLYQYKGYCTYCYINMFPDNTISRNYKTKEFAVRDYIIEKYPDFTWTCDKRVIDGCSKKRPDLILDLGYQIIIVEVDENQHTTYDCSCENKRLMEISKDINYRNLIFIRFNPDSYKTRENKTIKSCWKINKTNGILIILNQANWDNRLKILEETVKYWIDNETNKMIEVVELFYDRFE